MLDEDEIREIPGYDNYGVTENGTIVSFKRNTVLSSYMLNGYFIVDTFRGSLTETLPVHRAVALAWVDNPKPDKFIVVNHKDGNKTNNHRLNLEWTDYSGNAYHAVNNGLRNDNIQCKIRDFFTKEVLNFSSMAQAAEYMQLPKDTPAYMLSPKMFGKLVANRFEFRFADDPRPWFYETRKDLISPVRFMVVVENEDGTKRETFSTKALLKEYQLYDCPGRTITELAEFGNLKYPNKKFVVFDSYLENSFKVARKTNLSIRVSVVASLADKKLKFTSLTKCANHFKVDRSSITARLKNGNKLDGWDFSIA